MKHNNNIRCPFCHEIVSFHLREDEKRGSCVCSEWEIEGDNYIRLTPLSKRVCLQCNSKNSIRLFLNFQLQRDKYCFMKCSVCNTVTVRKAGMGGVTPSPKSPTYRASVLKRKLFRTLYVQEGANDQRLQRVV